MNRNIPAHAHTVLRIIQGGLHVFARHAFSKADGRTPEFARVDRERQSGVRQNLYLRTYVRSRPQHIDSALRRRERRGLRRIAPRVFESDIKFHTTNACRFRKHELQISDMTVERSSIFVSLERRLRMMLRHQAIRHVAGQPDLVRPASQCSCDFLRSVVGPTNPRPL